VVKIKGRKKKYLKFSVENIRL